MDHSETATEEVETTETLPEEEHSQTQEDSDGPDELTKERWKQQLTGKQAQLDQIRNIAIEAQVKLAEQSVDNLLELNKTDPKMAKEVAQRFNFKSVQEAHKRAQDQAKASNDSWLTEDEFNKRYQEQRSKERHEEALQLADEIISQLPAHIQEEAKAYFDDITEGKTLDATKAKKYADMATLYVSKDKPWNKEEWLKKLASNWVSTSKASKWTERKVSIQWGKLIYLD